jgi:hypothetical protein
MKSCIIIKCLAIISLVACVDWSAAMEDGGSLKTIKIPTFDGKEKNYYSWWMKFMAFCAMSGLTAALGTRAKADLTNNEVPQAGESNDQKKARSRNLQAMHVLTLSFASEKLYNIINSSKTIAWPSGLVHRVVVALNMKYQPTDEISGVEARVELSKLVLKYKKDPEEFFESMIAVKNKYAHSQGALTDQDLIAHTMAVASGGYKLVIGTVTEIKAQANTRITLESLQEALYQHYRHLKGEESVTGQTGKSNSPEVSFVAGEAETQTCFHCKKKGHIQANYPDLPKKDKARNGTGKNADKFCTTCKKKGHVAENCWSDPKNANNVPRWAKSMIKKKQAKSEVGAPAIEAAKDNEAVHEVLFVAAQTFPSNLELLKDKNVFLFDICASTDMTGHREGMVNCREAKESEKAKKCANGGISKAKEVGNLHLTFCDNTGLEVMPIITKDMEYYPECPYNVLSGPKRLLQGWKLSGDKDCLVISKDGIEIRFNIIIRTEKSCLYVAYMKQNMVTETGIVAAIVKEVHVNAEQAHGRLGHMSEELTRRAAKSLEWKVIRGAMPPCESCTIGKARQKNVLKSVPKDVGSIKLHLDISTLKPKEENEKKASKYIWRMMVFSKVGLKISDMFTTKAAMVDPTLVKLHNMQTNKILPKTLRMDMAGENKKLEEKMTSDQLESLGLKVHKPMVLEMDNKGAIDLVNSWSSAGRTRHVLTKINFLRELKEQALLICRWIPGNSNSMDIFTKNIGGTTFKSCVKLIAVWMSINHNRRVMLLTDRCLITLPLMLAVYFDLVCIWSCVPEADITSIDGRGCRTYIGSVVHQWMDGQTK